jgi:hypothetical protein
MAISLPPGPIVERLDGFEFDAQFLDALDEADELGLVDHVAGQHREPVLPFQRHPPEAFLELITEFAA